MRHKILVSHDVPSEGVQYLIERGYEIKHGIGDDPRILQEEIGDCDAILAGSEIYTADLLEKAKNLKIIARIGIDAGNIDLRAASRLGIAVTITPLACSNAITDNVLGQMIAFSQNWNAFGPESVGPGDQRYTGCPRYDLEGKTLGIIGFVKVGWMLANKAVLGLGMKVIAHGWKSQPEQITSKIEITEDLQYLLQKSDFVCLILPSLLETPIRIGEPEIGQMKPTSYFIIISGLESVSESVLIQSLRQKRIAGAGILAEWREAYRSHPLLRMENVLFLPHDTVFTEEAKKRMSLHAAIEIDDVFSGGNPSWQIHDYECTTEK